MKQASIKYGIPIGTLSNKCNGKHGRKHVGQTILAAQEEEDLSSVLLTMAVWKAPLSLLELRMLVKDMLDKCGKTCPKFRENLPGVEWARSFLSRNKNLSQRLTQNIKLSRAVVGETELNAYFDHLAESLQGVPNCNIWNFDETNFSDEPERKRAIVK